MIKLLLVATTFVALAVEAQNQNVCQLVLDCVQDAQKAQQNCDSLKRSNSTGGNTNKPPKDNKCDVAEQQKQIKAKTDEQKKMYVDCLKSRLSQSFDEMQSKKERKQEQCQSAIKNYQNPSGSGSAGGNDSSRLVRQAADSDNDGSNNGNNGLGRKGGKGKGKDGGGKRGNNPAKECQRSAKQKFKQCKAIAECCSETTICHLQFELSTLHDDIRKLQLEVATKKHDCLKAKVDQTSGKNATPPKMLRDSPLSSSHNGESMQDSIDDDDTKFDTKNDLDKFYTNFDSEEDDM